MGISPAKQEQKQILLHFLEQQPLLNTFLLADIERYGFHNPFQQIWADWRGGIPSAVYLRFYQNLILYGHGQGIDLAFVRRITAQYGILVIMGPGEDMAALAPLAGEGWKAVDKGLYALNGEEKLPPATGHTLQPATCDDVDTIHAFLQGIEGFGSMYASRQMLADRIATGDGIHILLKRDGRLLAHANSTAASHTSVMLGGVATLESARGQGYASAVVAALCRRVLAEQKRPCIFSDAPLGHNLFERLGFERLGSWCMLERPALFGGGS